MLLKDSSYYKTGGSVDRLYAPNTIQELSTVVKSLFRDKTPYFLLGAGSNSLIMDEHWAGAVIVFQNLNRIKLSDSIVIAEAGVENTALAEACLNASLSGASWLNYLPGQIGSTARMNARCYGGEIAQIVKSVSAVSPEGQVISYKNSDIFYGYKSTRFMSNSEIVVEVELQLQKGSNKAIEQHMEECKSDREEKQQFRHPSCGCVFKNNYDAGIPSGMLLDKAGVRRLNTSTVEISPYHANFVFNKGATAIEILQTTLEMRELVYDKFGVWLEYEMEVLGTMPENLKNRFNEKRQQAFKSKQLASLRTIFNS